MNKNVKNSYMDLTGRIIKGIGGFYYVDAAGVLYETRARGLFRKQGITPLVGDSVTIEVIDETEKTAFLTDIQDRRSELIRPAVANVDQALVIFACAHPVPSTGLLDRFLINMERQEMETVIVLSKVDLLEDEDGRKLPELESLSNMYLFRILYMEKPRFFLDHRGLESHRSLIVLFRGSELKLVISVRS